MREDVCIVLNEREQLKTQLAEELENQLKKRLLSCSRLVPDEHTAQIILERAPRVAVVDYLLGDVSTAIDLLSVLAKASIDTRVVLWTDEPSVHVAVQAMKLGAVDYIEISQTTSLEKVIQAIEASFKQLEFDRLSLRPAVDSNKLIAQSKCYQETLSLARSVAKRQEAVVVLSGESGCGRTALGQLIHRNRDDAGTLIEIDFDTWPYDLRLICGDPLAPRIVPYLSHQATVVIDHIEFDSGELLNTIHENLRRLWPELNDPVAPLLIVGTTDRSTAQCWARLAQATIVEVPSLHEREEDFWPLVQRFAHEAQQLDEANKLKFSAASVEKLSGLSWPGNITQLRFAVIEAATTPLGQLQEELKQSERKSRDPSPKEEQLTIRAVTAAKSRWERYQLHKPYIPEPLIARAALDRALGNMRIAAASLGTGVAQIQAALSSTTAMPAQAN